MPNYVRIAGTDIYLRVFEQGDFTFINGSAQANAAVEFDLARDFADARTVCGSDALPTTKYYFTFEGQKTNLNNQAVWKSGNYPVIWGMWGKSGKETIYLALLRGGFNPSSNAMNYYLPIVTCDGVTFESTNQSTAYMPVSELTVYENNPNFEPEQPDEPVAPDEPENKHCKIIAFALRKAGVPMAEMISHMLCKKPVIPDEPVIPDTPTNYLTFASAEPFTLSVNNATKNWDGTLEYSTDTAIWNEWDGTTAIASAVHGGEQKIYMRGSGNSKIIGSQNDKYRWVLTGNNIRCEGNIENLLDYETVAIGEHPDMYGDCCYYGLFMGCTSLVTAPELPATTLATNCYKMMFRGCTSLTQAPKLPATTLGDGCYENMFMGCTSLVTAPELPATTLIYKGYRGMFLGCTSLTQVPKLSATTAETYCCQYMFKGCTSIKISATQTDEYTTEYRIPTSGTIEDVGGEFYDMFSDTGGTFTGTPSINTTYYLHISNSVV